MKRTTSTQSNNHQPALLAAVVGNPNVGKSVLFTALSGTYATVSNYPGTSVEVTRGTLTVDQTHWNIVDTPGTYSFHPVTEEERVARNIILNEHPSVILHVIDAKNLERMLPLTLQLLEAGLPLILVLNMMDEADSAGIAIDTERLSNELGVPVLPVVATRKQGLLQVSNALAAVAQSHKPAPVGIRYSALMEEGLATLAPQLQPLADHLRISARAAALFILREDEDILAAAQRVIPEPTLTTLLAQAQQLTANLADPVPYQIAVSLKKEATRLAAIAVTDSDTTTPFREKLSRIMLNPITGLPLLLAVLYLGLYKFVGQFGAGTVVDYLEDHLFETHLTPWLVTTVDSIIPWQAGRDLFVGEYGVLTMGVRYAFALLLPIVTFFFIVFAIIEDTGYLPRIAMLMDRTFKKIGLSGRAVIPIVLGLGCDTMATMVTRTLATRRERMIATLLLSLAIPCSAQLGVILAVLENHPAGAAVWTTVLILVFMVAGYLAARLMPGERPSFYMELPPLRLPQLSNVLIKTCARVAWYFREVMPLFVVASILIWLGQLVGLFDWLLVALHGPVRALNLPEATAPVFLFGFFRRDYGAAGLYDLAKHGLLTGNQLVVASVALTLFLPCIAQFLMNVKERGLKAGLLMSALVIVISFSTGWLLNLILTVTGVTL